MLENGIPIDNEDYWSHFCGVMRIQRHSIVMLLFVGLETNRMIATWTVATWPMQAMRPDLFVFVILSSVLQFC